MHDLASFSLADMSDCGAALRRLAEGPRCMVDVADRIVHHLHESLGDPKTASRSCVLVRLYKTHPYRELDPDLQAFARGMAGGTPLGDDVRCLTLLATAGDRPEWNDRAASRGHRAIPLLSEATVRSVPMIARLIHQLGIDIQQVLAPDPSFLRQAGRRSFNVFYVPHARGSEYVPAQEDFVIPNDVRSALGFGGVLPSGSLFAVIAFSRVFVPEATADQFKTLALNVKVALLPHDGGRIFAP